MGCARLSLIGAGKKIDNYYTSEICKNAIKINDSNFDDETNFGDVENWMGWDIDWGSIDLLVGGSPCQGFSRAGNELNFNDSRSKLFFVFVDILDHIKKLNPEIKFLLENVKMRKEYQDIITEYIGVDPVMIDGKNGYLQARPRLYWFNFDKKKSYIGAYNNISDILCATEFDEKKLSDNQRVNGVTENERGFRAHRGDKRKTGISELGRILKPTASYTDTITTTHAPKILTKNNGDIYYRSATIAECEKLSGLPVGYTKAVSDRQALKAIGNGWHVGITTDIFSAL
jgi:DNA (cytosine-5)-methyltransferase 3A